MTNFDYDVVIVGSGGLLRWRGPTSGEETDR